MSVCLNYRAVQKWRNEITNDPTDKKKKKCFRPFDGEWERRRGRGENKGRNKTGRVEREEKREKKAARRQTIAADKVVSHEKCR